MSRRALGRICIALFALSTAFPVVAGVLNPSRPSHWMGIADVAVAALLFCSTAAVWVRGRRRYEGPTANHSIGQTVEAAQCSRVLLLVWALAQACTGRPDTQPLASEVQWQVVDTTWGPSWDAKEDSVTTYRIAVEARGAIDTLEHVIEPWPLAIGDSVLTGLRLRFETGGPAGEREIFRLELPSKRLRSWAIPADVWYFFRDIAVSPNGGFVAYVAGQPGTHAVVRSIEGGSVVARGPVTEGCECDVDRHHARWVAADSFEVAVWGATPEGGWLLVAGRARPNRFTLDTLSAEPNWRAQRSRP